MRKSQSAPTLNYFEYLAETFPVMSASDEFDFLPRSADASRFYDRLDSLDGKTIEECIFTLRTFRDKFDSLAHREGNLERLTDLVMLKASATGVLMEMEENQSWRRNPLLYLKIAFIGLDHSLTKPAADDQERTERTLERAHEIPRLFQQAVNNINRVPETHYSAAISMLNDCLGYLAEIEQDRENRNVRQLKAPLQRVRSSLDSFGKFLRGIVPAPDREFAAGGLDVTLKDRFLSDRTLPEIYEIALEEWRRNLEQLEKLRVRIDPGKSWRELYHAYLPENVSRMDTIDLYHREMERLKSFFEMRGFPRDSRTPDPVICETPTYLRSVRGSASFAAAFSKDAREKDFFFITTHPHDTRSRESTDLLRKRLHREYKFLAAHETFPGHFLLDSTRRMLENPVRSQIESPLFYEGWAYYVESLLAETGYIDLPMDRLVDCKRRLWRAARCRIDIGLNSGMLGVNEAAELLTATGFSPEEAKGQIDRFRLNPGYQLCYSLGRFEILKLRDTYEAKMGRDAFHRQLLDGGEAPFNLIEKRLEAYAGTV